MAGLGVTKVTFQPTIGLLSRQKKQFFNRSNEKIDVNFT